MSKLSQQSQALVRELLEVAQLKVDDIPRCDTKTADFLAYDDRHRYLVEVTDRQPAKDHRDFIDRLVHDGGATLTRTPDRRDRLDRAVVEKDEQLRRTPVSADFRVAWITALNDDADHLLEELFRTVYGSVELQALRVDDYTPARMLSGMQHHVCFYYDLFSFFRVRGLQAVAFTSEEHVGLFVNPLADDIDAFRTSRLVAAFAERGGLVDPLAWPDAMHMPLDVDRSKPSARHAALLAKYKLLTQTPRASVFSARLLLRTSRNPAPG